MGAGGMQMIVENGVLIDFPTSSGYLLGGACRPLVVSICGRWILHNTVAPSNEKKDMQQHASYKTHKIQPYTRTLNHIHAIVFNENVLTLIDREAGRQAGIDRWLDSQPGDSH